MADVTILICACGMRLKAAGAIPGRVGKCPACGGLLRVPDAGTSPPPPPPDTSNAEATDKGYGLEGSRLARPTTYQARRDRLPRGGVAHATRWEGWIRVPEKPETRLCESLLYPLWGETGLALLILLPPVFWLASIPLLTLFSLWSTGALGFQLAAMMGILPSALFLVPIGSFALLYFGRVIATSAVGEVHHPRWPDWDPAEMLRGLGRWIWAILIGGILGGFPSVAYWLYCGDVDLFDAVIILELAAAGAIYGQVALLASILYDDPLGAHPVTVILAIKRVGWAWLVPSIIIASFAILSCLALVVVLEIQNPLISAFAYWLFWVFLAYGTMVVLRVLGLFYHRHAQVLGWFHERPRWGG